MNTQTNQTETANAIPKMRHYACVAYVRENTGVQEHIPAEPFLWVREKFLVKAHNEIDACEEVRRQYHLRKESYDPKWVVVHLYQTGDDNHYTLGCVRASCYFHN